MITKTIILLDGVTATGPSVTVGSLKLLNKTVQIYGTFTATIVVEVSSDGTNWYTAGSLTAPGRILVNEIWTFIRANVTAYTSGTIYARLMARE